MTKEEIAQHVATARASVVKGHVWLTGRIIAAMADENDRLRAEVERLESLFQQTHGCHWSWVYKATRLDAERADEVAQLEAALAEATRRG